MNGFSALWVKLRDKAYRDAFVAAQVKQAIPLQIRTLLKARDLTQAELAHRSGLTQGVISRAADPDYGNLSLNTLVRIAAGFDVAFVGKFVPFSELGRWIDNLHDETIRVPTFETEDAQDHAQSSAAMEADDTSGNIKGIKLLKEVTGKPQMLKATLSLQQDGSPRAAYI